MDGVILINGYTYCTRKNEGLGLFIPLAAQYNSNAVGLSQSDFFKDCILSTLYQ